MQLKTPQLYERFLQSNNDTDVQLIKINVSQSSRLWSTNQILKTIIITSSCEVERVHKSQTNDWNLAGEILEQMPASEYRRNAKVLGSFGFCTSQKTLLKSVRNYGDQGQYNGEIMIPWYLKSNNVGAKYSTNNASDVSNKK
jgi:hypothetical protein